MCSQYVPVCKYGELTPPCDTCTSAWLGAGLNEREVLWAVPPGMFNMPDWATLGTESQELILVRYIAVGSSCLTVRAYCHHIFHKGGCLVSCRIQNFVYYWLFNRYACDTLICQVEHDPLRLLTSPAPLLSPTPSNI